MTSAAELSIAPGAAQVPSFDALMWPTLEALKAMGGSGTNEEILAKVIEVAQIPPEVQTVQHTDGRQTKLNYNVAWAKSYLKKAGAIDNSTRGVWSITKQGETVTSTEVGAVLARVRKQSRKGRGAGDRPPPAEDGFELAVEADGEAGETYWRDELLDTLRGLIAAAFERLAQRLLREAGFVTVEVTGRSGDGGIDGIGVLRVNLLSFQVLFSANVIKAQ